MFLSVHINKFYKKIVKYSACGFWKLVVNLKACGFKRKTCWFNIIFNCMLEPKDLWRLCQPWGFLSAACPKQKISGV
jgi:ubiquitin C-terminal hydrolase